MPQSFINIKIHLVFSTRDRYKFLVDPDLRKEMHAWLGGISRKNNCPSVKIGGTSNHVHLLCVFGRDVSVSDWVRELKRGASKWAKSRDRSLSKFNWQSGYSAFAVSESNVRRVVKYIENQEEHHRSRSYKDEVRALLRKHGCKWDERYVWD